MKKEERENFRVLIPVVDPRKMENAKRRLTSYPIAWLERTETGFDLVMTDGHAGIMFENLHFMNAPEGRDVFVLREDFWEVVNYRAFRDRPGVWVEFAHLDPFSAFATITVGGEGTVSIKFASNVTVSGREKIPGARELITREREREGGDSAFIDLGLLAQTMKAAGMNLSTSRGSQRARAATVRVKSSPAGKYDAPTVIEFAAVRGKPSFSAVIMGLARDGGER